MNIKITALLAGLFLLPAAILAQGGMGTMPKVGEEFPEFSGETIDGTEFSLSDYEGKVLLIDFWATWCGPCIAEMPTINKAYNLFQNEGFEVLGVSLDHNEEALEKFYNDPATAPPYPSIWEYADGRPDLTERFGIQGIPAPFLLNREGTVVAAGAELRGENLLQKVKQALGSDTDIPESFESIAMKFLSGQEVDEATLIELAHQNLVRANALAWEVMTKHEVSREQAATFVKMLQPYEEEPTRYNGLDTLALAYYKAGNPMRARFLQNKAMENIAEQVKAKYPNVTDEMISRSPAYNEFAVRLALYQAAAGQTAKAREYLEKLQEYESLRLMFQENQFVKMLKDELAAGQSV